MRLDEGILITFEGIEGSGKTTQLKILEDHLKMEQEEVMSTREPGGTLIGNKIRKMLLDPEHANLAPIAELLLYIAARAQHVRELIRPALDAGKIVLCDRFYDATRAYQGGARNLPLNLVQQLNELATEGLQPRLTFLFDCPVQTGLKRARDRYTSKGETAKGDRIEQEEILFHEKVRETYLNIAREEPNRFVVMDGTQDIDRLHEKVLQEIKRIL